MTTRVFRRPYGSGPYCVSVQVSFIDAESAQDFARAIDTMKSQAALRRMSLSRQLLAAIRPKPRERKERKPGRLRRVVDPPWQVTR